MLARCRPGRDREQAQRDPGSQDSRTSGLGEGGKCKISVQEVKAWTCKALRSLTGRESLREQEAWLGTGCEREPRPHGEAGRGFLEQMGTRRLREATALLKGLGVFFVFHPTVPRLKPAENIASMTV